MSLFLSNLITKYQLLKYKTIKNLIYVNMYQ